MKKNGFTLIEIIGAIVILGIIAIIAFATYTRNLSGFRENYYTSERKTLEKTAQEFFDDNRNYRPTKILNAQDVTIETLATKQYMNLLTDYNGEACDKSSYALIVNEGNGDFSYHACLICDKDGYDNTNEDIYCDKSWLDPTKVEYGIGTVNKIYVYKGTTREKLKEQLELPISYIRKDNNGKVIAERRGTREGSEILSPVDLDAVDTNTIGNYKVTYKYGMEEKTREVRVYEHKAPNIVYEKENTVAKNLNGETKKEKKTYTPGEWAQSIIVTLSSKAFEDTNITGKGYQWNVDGRWQDFCSSDPCTKTITREMNQSVEFRLVDINDNVSMTTSPAIFKIDRTSPICSLKVPTTKGDNDWYKTNVDIQFNEKTDPKAGNDETVVSGIKQYNIQASTENLTRVATTVSKTHTQDTGGIKYIGYVEDEAENFSTCEVTLKKDATLPSCTSNGDSTTWTKNDRTITYGCSDTLSGCNTSYSGGSKKFTTTTKTSSIEAYTIKDNAGNSKECAVRTANVYVDKTAPSCTNSGDSTTWTKNDRTITWGGNDSESGCPNCGGSKKFTTTTEKSSIAAYTITDGAGNSTTCAARTANVYVDKTAPSCTNGGDSTTWTKNDRTITWGGNDSESGCPNCGGSKKFTTTTEKSSIAAYTITDGAGNSTTCAARTANVYVDKTAPTCTNSGDSTTWTKNDRTITWSCNDGNSGCTGGGSKKFTTTTKTSSISAYTITDGAGNSTTCAARTANVYVDKTAPTCTNSGDSTTWTKNDRTITWGGNDSDSGCSNCGGSKTFNTTTKTSSISAYTITDGAGNSVSCPARTANVYVDKTAPSCTNGGDSTTWTKNDRTITWGGNDSESGCSNCGGSKKFTTTTEKSSIAAYTITDGAGNSTTCAARTANVYVDKTAPSCTNSGDSRTWTDSNRTIYYGCSDSNSGCDTSYSGGSRLFNTTTTTATIAAYTIKDKAGNSKDCPSRTAEVYVTKEPPSCSVSKSNTYTEGGVTTAVTCVSAIGCDTSRNPTGDTGLKSSKTYTVYDRSGKSGTCSVTVSTQLQAMTWTCKSGYTCSRSGCGSETKNFSGSTPSCGGSCYNMGGASDLGGGQFRWNCTCYKTCSAPSVCGCGEWNPPSDWYNVSGCNTAGCVNGTYEGNNKWDDYRTVYY